MDFRTFSNIKGNNNNSYQAKVNNCISYFDFLKSENEEIIKIEWENRIFVTL